MKYLHKTSIVLLLLTVTVVRIVSQDSSAIDLDLYSNIYDTLLIDLGNRLSTRAKTDYIKETYSVCVQKIREGKLNLLINPKDTTILSGGRFVTKTDGTVSIVLTKTLLDAYRKENSIVCSILIHEMKHAHDYFYNTEEYEKSYSDEKVRYWYELDALNVEARFIEECTEEAERSSFEKYLLASWVNDNLDSASVILRSERMDTFFFFNRLIDNWNDKSMDRGEVLSEIKKYGENIFSEYSSLKNGDVLNLVFTVITANTFHKYTVRTVQTINDRPGATWGDFYKEFPEFERIINLSYEIAKKHFEEISAYRIKTISLWKEDIIKRL